jgi:phage terminase large subunit GpA-like protein
MILVPALKVIEPRSAMRTIDWALKYGYTDSGQPYNDFAYPHLSAPGGPFDAFDCEQYFDIWLQWASRLGKTFGGQICMMKQADCDPCPMMFASADEKLALEVVERTYGMINHCPQLAELLPPPMRRRQSKIDLRFSRVYVAWSRSGSTLADKAARMLHANEIDKWEHASTSREADPFQLADERCKEFPTYKRWKEGTPQERGSSRVERGRLGSCNALYWVPCVHCWKYQTLELSGPDTAHGVKWDKNAANKSDPELARQTGRYVCRHCEEDLLDEHRGRMMRLGVWVPEGCAVDDAKARAAAETWREAGRDVWRGWKFSSWVTGSPVRDGREWGSRLSSIHALSLSWGDYAAKFVAAKDKPQELRNFKNSWEAVTWEHTRRKTTWEVLGERVIDKETRHSRGIVPAWASLLTAAADRQEDRMPWIVDAWGPEGLNATIAYGEAGTFDELLEVMAAHWTHADGGTQLQISLALCDAKYRPDGVHDFCARCQSRGMKVFPSNGSSTDLKSEYDISHGRPGSARPGAPMVFVDSNRSQLWIEEQLEGKLPFSLYNASLLEHQDFLEQLLNEAAVDKDDATNHVRRSWHRINENIPNDFRDCKRYAQVAKLIHTAGRDVPARTAAATPKRSAVINPGINSNRTARW